MKIMTRTFILLAAFLSAMACSKKKITYDASGAFEMEETLISAEAQGVIRQFDIEEGQTLTAGQYLGFIDTTQLSLKIQQLYEQVNVLLSQKPDIASQLAALEAQLKAAKKEQQRFTLLVKAHAAAQKLLDDINAQVEVITKQIEALKSSLNIATENLVRQTKPLESQIEQLRDQILKCKIINPIAGTVLTKFAETNEMASPGKALYSLGDLKTIHLRAYVSEEQLALIQVNRKVRVSTNAGKAFEGKIIHISDKAEFTPKTIQTKEERANLVYAVKIAVVNDGSLKPGMYGEVNWTDQ